MKVIRNPRKSGASPNNRLPIGAAHIADSLEEGDLFIAIRFGNRATRRLAMRNLRKKLGVSHAGK